MQLYFNVPAKRHIIRQMALAGCASVTDDKRRDKQKDRQQWRYGNICRNSMRTVPDIFAIYFYVHFSTFSYGKRFSTASNVAGPIKTKTCLCLWITSYYSDTQGLRGYRKLFSGVSWYRRDGSVWIKMSRKNPPKYRSNGKRKGQH